MIVTSVTLAVLFYIQKIDRTTFNLAANNVVLTGTYEDYIQHNHKCQFYK